MGLKKGESRLDSGALDFRSNALESKGCRKPRLTDRSSGIGMATSRIVCQEPPVKTHFREEPKKGPPLSENENFSLNSR